MAVTVALFFLGARILFQKRSILFAFPVLFLAYVVFYVAFKGRVDFSWYGIPSGLGYIITVSVGLASVARRLIATRARERWHRILVPSVAMILIISSLLVWQVTRLPYYHIMRESYERAGQFVNKYAEADARVLVDETGMIGYQAKRFVCDLGGIVSPEILRYCAMRDWKLPWSDLLKEFRPDFVVFNRYHLNSLLTEGDVRWVHANYEVVAEFSTHTVLRRVH